MEKAVKVDDEVNETLSDKGEAEGPSETGDVEMESQEAKIIVTDIKMETVETPVKEESTGADATEVLPKEEAPPAIADIAPTNAMEIDRNSP